MMDFVFKHKKKILIGGAVAFLILLGVVIYLKIEDSLKNVTVNISVAPLMAKVKIGESVFSSTETVRIKPGFYKVEVFADGFITKTGELKAVENETTNISLYLDPTDENSDWYKDHVWDGTARADIISNESMQEYYNLQKQYLILNNVPYNAFNYTINYENECAENDGGVCLIIDAQFGVRDYAVQYLQSIGDDLSLYYIKGYDVPFKDIELDMPVGLEFDGELTDTTMSADNMNKISNIVNDYIDSSFDSTEFNVAIDRVKNYDNHYYCITLAVYSGDNIEIHDTYRMIVGQFDGEWMALTNADIILAQSQNPLVPKEVLRLVNNF